MSNKNKNQSEFYGATDPALTAMVADAKAKAASASPVMPLRVPSLHEGRMVLAEQGRNVWRVTVPGGVTLEEAIQPKFWAHVASKFRLYDRVEIIPDDGSWLADAIVRDVARHAATLGILNKWDLEPVEVVGDMIDFDIEHLASLGWCVNRKSDGARLVERLNTKSQAAGWIAENGKSYQVA